MIIKEVPILKNNKLRLDGLELLLLEDTSVQISPFSVTIGDYLYQYDGLHGGIWYPKSGDLIYLGLQDNKLVLIHLDKNSDKISEDLNSKYSISGTHTKDFGIIIWVIDNIVYYLKFHS